MQVLKQRYKKLERMLDMSDQFGCIFLSHASPDKALVEKVYHKLDLSSTFYDIKSVSPGGSFLEAMKAGVAGQNVFVLFHSRHTNNTWVEYEKHLAEINHASGKARLLVVPVDGESYRTLPAWMQGYMTCPPDFTPSDIARQILHLQYELIGKVGPGTGALVGRESLLRSIHLKTVKNIQVTGAPLQHIILSGFAGMGRTSVARSILLTSLKSMLPAGPVFDLPDMADAVDFYLAMRQDMFGAASKESVEEQIEFFQSLPPKEQAEAVLELCKHWAGNNQAILVKTKFGLRDRDRDIKNWLKNFFDLSKSVPALRMIYISERRLPDDIALGVPNICQFRVDELDDDEIQFIISELVESRYYDASRAEHLAKKIHGHPATAHYASELVNSGRSIESINESSDPINAFQERVVGAILSSETVTESQRKIAALLGIFPKLSFGVMARVLEMSRKELALDLWELQEASLVTAADGEYYALPRIVASRARKELTDDSERLVNEVKEIIIEDIDGGKLDSQIIDALLIASAGSSGEIPENLSSLVTASSLLAMVNDRFFSAREARKGAKDIYLSAYNLSRLALSMRASDDAVEQILFTGGDSAIRAGLLPEDIIAHMTSAGFPSVYYLKGSYAFHVEKDDKEAAKNLKLSLEMKHFKLRNTRLLARALIRMQDFSGALAALNELSSSQLERETGLIIQKVRALRGMRNYREADILERKIAGRNDEFGEVELFKAGKALREGRHDDALGHLKRAEGCAKVNRFSHDLLKCAVLLEKGDASLLPLMVETATSVNRKFDAYQLQARHAVVQGDWREAERFIDRIEKKDYYDLQISLRMLRKKMEDIEIRTDPLEMARCQEKIDEVARLSVTSPEGFRSA